MNSSSRKTMNPPRETPPLPWSVERSISEHAVSDKILDAAGNCVGYVEEGLGKSIVRAVEFYARYQVRAAMRRCGR